MISRSNAVIAAFVASSLMSGCSTLGVDAHSEPVCGAQLGDPCTTIQQADGHGGAATTLAEKPDDTRASELSQNLLMAGKNNTPALGAPDGGAPYYVQAYRVPERLATAWIAPRLDEDGIFHEATFIHFVVREASWGRRGS